MPPLCPDQVSVCCWQERSKDEALILSGRRVGHGAGLMHRYSITKTPRVHTSYAFYPSSLYVRQRRSNIRDRRVARWADNLTKECHIPASAEVPPPGLGVARHASLSCRRGRHGCTRPPQPQPTRHASHATSRLRRRLPARPLLLERVHRRIHLRAAPPRLATTITTAATSTSATATTATTAATATAAVATLAAHHDGHKARGC